MLFCLKNVKNNSVRRSALNILLNVAASGVAFGEKLDYFLTSNQM
uniref:Uncharacterized protein n=1 Tax=Anguilla anguilla TaxID=7936 RepID=A0A0E9RFL7_ANGAN